MQSIFMAVSDLIAYILYKSKPVPPKVEPKPSGEEAPVGYRPLFFHCWLCKGTTKFALKNSIKKKRFTMECCRCGVENVVSVGF